MLKQIPTLILVTVVTILVWVFAEAETLRSREVPVEIVFTPDARGERTLEVKSRFDPGAGGTQIIKGTIFLEGSASAVDEAERVLRKPLRFDPFLESMAIDPGVEQAVDLKALVRSHHDLRGIANAIKRVDPSHASLVVGVLASREVDVRVEVSAGEAEGVPEAKPSRVKVRLPQSLASRLGEGAYARAVVDPVTAQRLVPGRKETIPGVRLEAPASLAGEREVHLDPPQVEVTLTLKNRSPTSRPTSVPVQIVLAGVEQNAWEIALAPGDEFIPDVTATGPAEIIRQIDERSLPVVALLPLSFTELEGGQVTSKDVILTTMPPTAAAVRFDAPHKSVSFTVKRRPQRAP